MACRMAWQASPMVVFCGPFLAGHEPAKVLAILPVEAASGDNRRWPPTGAKPSFGPSGFEAGN